MATLHVRGVPDGLYKHIHVLAGAEGRSLGAEIVHLLDRAVAAEEAQVSQSRLLATISRRRRSKTLRAGTPDSVKLLGEDRRR